MNRKVFLLSGFVISLLLVFFASFIVRLRVSTRGKAAESSVNKVFSAENSFIYASPMSAKADGISVIRIFVYLLDNQGKGMADKEIVLKAKKQLEIIEVNSVTDRYGKVTYDIVSKIPGSYTIQAFVSEKALPIAVEVSFE